MDAKRKKAETLIYNTMDAMDPSKQVSGYYRKLFAGMNDKQFKEYISGKFPYRFHCRLFKIEPKMSQIDKAAKLVNAPILEKISLPYIYEDEKGNAVTTHEALVFYLNLKKMKQFLTKKNGISTNIAKRDGKTGRLTGGDKNGATSDREMECLVISGMNHTMKELSRPRADGIESKEAMYNTISALGSVSMEDLPDTGGTDVLSKNLLNVYLIGSHINTNLVNTGNYTPYTATLKKASRREG